MARFGKSRSLGFLVALIFISALPFALYRPLDRIGWILHTNNTPVWIEGDWQVGEYRKCQMLLATPRLFCGTWESADVGSLSGYISSVTNDDFDAAFKASMTRNGEADWTRLSKYFELLPVLYHGRIERPDHERDLVSWLCKRKQDSLTCNALD
jgi:hypothetical protein